MVIFHSYVSLPEGIHNLYASLCARWLDIIISGKVWQLKSWSRSKRNGSGDSRRVAHRLKDVTLATKMWCHSLKVNIQMMWKTMRPRKMI